MEIIVVMTRVLTAAMTIRLSMLLFVMLAAITPDHLEHRNITSGVDV